MFGLFGSEMYVRYAFMSIIVRLHACCSSDDVNLHVRGKPSDRCQYNIHICVFITARTNSLCTPPIHLYG